MHVIIKGTQNKKETGPHGCLVSQHVTWCMMVTAVIALNRIEDFQFRICCTINENTRVIEEIGEHSDSFLHTCTPLKAMGMLSFVTVPISRRVSVVGRIEISRTFRKLLSFPKRSEGNEVSKIAVRR